MSEALARPRVLEAQKVADTLVEKLGASIRDVTVADASAKTGLALRDAEKGLQWALAEYRGHLKVTEGGDLIFHFPTGFTKPWKTKETMQEWLARVGKSLWAVAKVAIKVWILAAIIFYTAIFVAIIIGMTLAALAGRSSDDRDDDRGFTFGDYLMWRVITDLVGDAIWATFHYRAIRDYEEMAAGRIRPQDRKPRKRLYERVFQFIFGPEGKPADPLEDEKRVLAIIRQRHGRIGMADVMAVTGLTHDEAERLITRLLVDYEGEIEVSEAGAVFYIFKDLRKTVDEKALPATVPMSWELPVRVAPLTGDNTAGSNLTIAALNGFNLVASGFAIASDLTLAKINAILQGIPIERIGDTGPAIFLGWIPFAYSLSIFALPAGRAVARLKDVAKAKWENGKRALLQLITRDPVAHHPPERLARAYENGAGEKPEEKALDQLLLKLGGDLEVTDDGRARWRFPELAREAAALTEARQGASATEKQLGAVVYDSSKDLPPN
ncbi:MAG: hypothetical protein AB2A00_12940 [Myxococcota bacterium]